MRFEGGRETGVHIPERIHEIEGVLDDVYIIPAQQEWGSPQKRGSIVETIYKTVQLKDARNKHKAHGIIVVINHSPHSSDEVKRENARTYQFIAGLNSSFKMSRADEPDSDRFQEKIDTIRASGVPIIPIYAVEEDMSVAVARHIGGEVAEPTLREDRSLMRTLDADTIPDDRSLAEVRRAFRDHPIDVASMQIALDLHSLPPQEYATYMNWSSACLLWSLTNGIDDWRRHVPFALHRDMPRETINRMTATAGAGTVITREAYRKLGGWQRVPGRQRGEDVDIGQRAVASGMNLFNMSNDTKVRGIPMSYTALHWTSPRDEGRADGQGNYIGKFKTDAEHSFDSLEVQSPAAVRLERSIYELLAVFRKGPGDGGPLYQNAFRSSMEHAGVGAAQAEELWSLYTSWDKQDNTKGHHDLVLKIRDVARQHDRTTIGEYISYLEDQCEQVSREMGEGELHDVKMGFLESNPKWGWGAFKDLCEHAFAHIQDELPAQHRSHDFYEKRKIAIMAEYILAVRGVYTFFVSLNDQVFRLAMQERFDAAQKPLPPDMRRISKDDVEYMTEKYAQVAAHSLQNALRRTLKRFRQIHTFTDAPQASEKVWDAWYSHLTGEDPRSRLGEDVQYLR